MPVVGAYGAEKPADAEVAELFGSDAVRADAAARRTRPESAHTRLALASLPRARPRR